MHDCACHTSFELKHGGINVNAVNSAAESARTDGQTARRSALQPVPLQPCDTVMTGVGPFNVTKLQQCLQFLRRFQAPLGLAFFAIVANVRDSARDRGDGRQHSRDNRPCALDRGSRMRPTPVELNYAGRDRFAAKVETAHQQLISVHGCLLPNWSWVEIADRR